VQEYSGVSAPDANLPRKLVYGEDHLLETFPLLKLDFCVSPSAFLQVNTRLAESLYAALPALSLCGMQGARALYGGALPSAFSSSAAASAAPVFINGLLPFAPPRAPDALMLDMCCGGGLIGLVHVPYAGRVIGVDSCERAIADAKKNARINGISKAEEELAEGEAAAVRFLCAKAEDVCPSLLPGLQKSSGLKRIVCVVDPPRGGLHPAVIRALRTCRGLNRLVYVSCNPAGSFVQDAARLCVPADRRHAYAAGPPFRPVCALPFDMFPHTREVECVTIFERGL
jgi:tRNA/tmRNA/rRNA uracil-C5-methylase (TrmA/RlmC/RlmD family)